ncbi:hypothetical protein C8Q77DRAFT_608980 [Trametes polyzona]|nr:hypothetical protein C8Q77DRAFT_608980 [Trametes polyzona]
MDAAHHINSRTTPGPPTSLGGRRRDGRNRLFSLHPDLVNRRTRRRCFFAHVDVFVVRVALSTNSYRRRRGLETHCQFCWRSRVLGRGNSLQQGGRFQTAEQSTTSVVRSVRRVLGWVRISSSDPGAVLVGRFLALVDSNTGRWTGGSGGALGGLQSHPCTCTFLCAGSSRLLILFDKYSHALQMDVSWLELVALHRRVSGGRGHRGGPWLT